MTKHALLLLVSLQTLKDVVATVDYKVPKVKGTTLNTKYEAGPKLYTVGATWEGKIANKAVTQKITFSNKDKKVAGKANFANGTLLQSDPALLEVVGSMLCDIDGKINPLCSFGLDRLACLHCRPERSLRCCSTYR
jgi:hypothetical protein